MRSAAVPVGRPKTQTARQNRKMPQANGSSDEIRPLGRPAAGMIEISAVSKAAAALGSFLEILYRPASLVRLDCHGSRSRWHARPRPCLLWPQCIFSGYNRSSIDCVCSRPLPACLQYMHTRHGKMRHTQPKQFLHTVARTYAPHSSPAMQAQKNFLHTTAPHRQGCRCCLAASSSPATHARQ